MVIGMRLFAGSAAHDGAADAIARAFQRRQPLTRAAISLDGAPAIAGAWIADAEPRFSEEGHFAGYFGRLRRVPDAAQAAGIGPEAREADRIRQLLHELRTPVTAVQGYAEVIQQQLFGPAPHEYRALAAAIAADAARILAGFEELDRLARLETGASGIEPGESDLAALLRRTAGQLAPVLAPQGAGFDLDFGGDACLMAAIDAEDAEGLVWRLLASLAAAAGPASLHRPGAAGRCRRGGAVCRHHSHRRERDQPRPVRHRLCAATGAGRSAGRRRRPAARGRRAALDAAPAWRE